MTEEKDNESSGPLKVNRGVEQPAAVDPEAAERFRKAAVPDWSAEDYIDRIRKGDRAALSKAITLAESTLARHSKLAQQIIEGCLPNAGNSVRIGVTGIPGVGKSTFLESLGTYLTGQDHKVAVLAIDPSSQRSRGSILGDKTRMEDLANDPNAFIRPSASAGTLGGVARKTREAIILCEAAGYDAIFVETVGVGQSETTVHSMVDFFLLLMITGVGDELQGIKRGIMEMADAMVINKADGDNIQRSEQAKQEFEKAFHLFPAPDSGWTPRVVTCSSITGKGIPDVWSMIMEYVAFARGSGYLDAHRKEQSVQTLNQVIEQTLYHDFYQHPGMMSRLSEIKRAIMEGKATPYKAAQQLIDAYRRGNR